LGTLWLTYYLTPDIQGEVSDAFIVVLTAHQVTTFGVAQYLVANPTSGREVAWHVTAFQFLLGVAAFGAVVLMRNHFGGMLDAPTMGQYVPGLALAMFIERTGAVPERLLARQLKFRTIGIGRTAGEFMYTVASVALAWLGWGGMAIVWGNVLRCLCTFAIVTSAVDRREWLSPSRLSVATLRPMLRYGVPLSIGTFATFASRRWDNLVVSSIFGAKVVGEYNLAYNLADIPAVQVGEQIGDVLFPSFSQMDPEQRRRALVRSTGLLALVVFPLAVGLGAIAPTVVHALLREEWYGVAPMLVILSALSVVRPIGWTIGAFLQASNRPRAAMWLGLSKIAFLLSSLFLLGQLTKDPLWACAAVGLAFGLHSLASMWAVRKDGVSMLALLGRCAGPLGATVPMAMAILGVRELLTRAGLQLSGLLLFVEVAIGAAAYVGAALVIARSTSKDFLDLVKDAVRRRGSGDGRPPSSEDLQREAEAASERVARSISQRHV
jgi:PST family polysaccharide transporter